MKDKKKVAMEVVIKVDDRWKKKEKERKGEEKKMGNRNQRRVVFLRF
jgi:hypothetical protein